MRKVLIKGPCLNSHFEISRAGSYVCTMLQSRDFHREAIVRNFPFTSKRTHTKTEKLLAQKDKHILVT